MLQQHFNNQTFKLEEAVYEAEKISFTHIAFIDNQVQHHFWLWLLLTVALAFVLTCCPSFLCSLALTMPPQPMLDLITKRPHGVLPLLDEELIVPNGSDNNFLEKLDQVKHCKSRISHFPFHVLHFTKQKKDITSPPPTLHCPSGTAE